MRLNTDDTYGLIATLDDMALKNGYGKIFAKIPAPAWNVFKSADYIKEAVVPGFFTGKTDGFFIAKYFSARRQKAQNVKKQFPDLWKYPKHDGMVQAFIIESFPKIRFLHLLVFKQGGGPVG